MKQTGIERPFGGEIRTFDLPLGSQRAVEAKCGVGLGRVLGRLWSSMATIRTADGERPNPVAFDFYGDDVREVLLQGLKGGGMPDAEATKLIANEYDSQPGKGQHAPLAVEIISAWWFGLPEGNGEAEKKNETVTAPAASTSTQSMEQVPL